MKILTSILSFIFCSAVFAQSPSLSVQFTMDKLDALTTSSNFKIEMKICIPIKNTEKKDWFSPETSAINFLTLTAADIDCGKYMIEGEGKEVLSGEVESPKPNSYYYSNQYFAWESILIFKITNTKSRALEPPMYVIMPIKYKSFVSSISIADVVYHSGNIVFIDNATATYPKKRLTINHSLKNETGIAVENSSYKDWVAN